VRHPSGPNPRGQPQPPKWRRGGSRRGAQPPQSAPTREVAPRGKGSWRNRLQKSESKNTRGEVAADAGVRADRYNKSHCKI
jgi:hypothetical protein